MDFEQWWSESKQYDKESTNVKIKWKKKKICIFF